MTLEELEKRYLDHLRAGGAARSTLSSTRRWLGVFCRECSARTAAEIVPEHLASFRQRLLWQPSVTGRLYSQNSVYQALRAVRSWLRWAASQGVLLVDPGENLVLPRPPRALVRVPTVEEVHRLLEVPSLETPQGLRNATLIDTFYTTGIRAGECHGLELADLDLPARTLKVRGKGSRERLVPTGERLAATLERYLDRARPELARAPCQALFLNRSGQRLSYVSLGAIVRKTALEAGLGSMGPHALRHACATHMLEGGAELAMIKLLLGHRHLSSTELYTHLRPTDLACEHRRTHPRCRREPDCGILSEETTT